MPTNTDTSPDTQDAWGTDNSSGFLQNFIGTVNEAYFGFDARYNSGQSLLMNWECTVNEALDEVDEVPETIDQKYPVGSNWETEDGGRTAQHTSGAGNKRFHASSLYGKIIDEATGASKGYGSNAQLAAGGAVETNLDGLMEVLRGRGNPTEAAVWTGLKFRFAEVVFDYGENKKTKEKMTSRRSMPVEFLGVGGEGGDAGKADDAAKADAEKKASAREKAEAKKAAKAAEEQKAAGKETAAGMLDALDGLDQEVRDKVLALLDEADDHTTFSDACLEVDGVMENDALLELIVDNDGGLWSTKA